MSQAPSTQSHASRAIPDYLPARMINEFVYCPRLFYYEQVQGVFVESADTIEGSVQHRRVDKEGGAAPAPDATVEEPLIARSITLSSERHRVIAKLDLAEFADGKAVPVDYKHGRPMSTEEGYQPWPSERVQLAVQALVLQANGYRCEEGIIYYTKSRQRVRVVFDEAVISEAQRAIDDAWRAVRLEQPPPPLIDSPKCPGCSLVGICLPDETLNLQSPLPAMDAPPARLQLQLFEVIPSGKPAERHADARLLIAARTDQRPLYLNTQGLRVGKNGGVLRINEKDTVVQDVRISDTCQVNLMGNIQISTQALQALCEEEVPVCYFSQGSWFYGITMGMNTKNVFLRKSQYKLADEPWFCLWLARKLVAGKIRNQRTMMLRNHIEPPKAALRDLKSLASRAEASSKIEELLGVEGAAARIYFAEFGAMLKASDAVGDVDPAFSFDFQSRNRRPPKDGTNALLSLAYSLLVKDLTVTCFAVGFDPMVGFYHQPRHGRPALALDLMEPLRPIIADSAVLTAINTRMVSPKDLVRAGDAVSLTAEGRRGFFRAYELRMDTLVTHPLFNYRVSYRRLLEIQARLLGKLIDHEIADYPVFVTK